MTPEQLAHLTDEERAAWDACEAAGLPWAEMGDPFHGEIRRCSDFAHLFTDEDDHPEARRFVGVASYALPLVLEALADARRERDSYRDGYLTVAASRAAMQYQRDVAWAALAEARARIAAFEAATPGEDPAPRGVGAPDAAKGGALGVGSACTYSRAWIGPCGKPGERGRCPDHASVVCSCCGASATGECPQTGGLVCGYPLCDDCEHDPKPGWHCAHRRKPGASGVGAALTNCDSCRFDYRDHADRPGCMVADGAEREELFSAVSDWVANDANINEYGDVVPGATGCPGYSPRGYATDATEEGDE